uniref:Uncharacterized protein n=1 Tax=Ceratitis capitata TaxID=7213 RepID=W8AZY2_CERCA
MSNIENLQRQKDLVRAIAMRALMHAGGEKCFCPVKKPTKFIVTLKPVVKMPNADPYLSLKVKSSACTCNTKSAHKPPTPAQLKVRQNNEALKGKTLLNAFGVLTNSTFITIDTKYDFGGKGMLSPSGQKIRLCGGAHEPQKNIETCQCAEETAISTEAPSTENRFLQPEQQTEPKSEPEKLIKSYAQPKASHGHMVLCKNERIYRILQHGCYEEKKKKESTPKYRIVYPVGGGAKEEKKRVLKKVKEKRKTKGKGQARKQSIEPSREGSRKPSRERAQIKRELESEPELERVTPPPMTPPRRCGEKAEGTTDAPSNTTSQQHQQAQPTALDLLSWNPLKYFDINCNGGPQAKANKEPCAVDPPCTLSLFPFPSLRKPEKPAEPIAAITTKPTKQAASANMREAEFSPCHENQVDPQPQAEPVQPVPANINEEIIRAQCSRILNLELQVNELRRELGRMKTEIIPPDEMLRCTALTSKLRELSTLLADLKSQHMEAMTSVLMAQRQATATCTKSKCIADTQTPQLPPPTPPPPRPIMKAEKVQANLLADHAHKISQTNASFGWRPFIDEATQSSPPSTVPVTPKHTSSVPASTLTSSAASACLPCRHDTGEIPLKETPSFCPYCQDSAYPRCPYVERHLEKEIMRIVQSHPPCEVLLSVMLQPNSLYHINISLTCTGEPLGCIYATEHAINEAVEADVFARFLTFFIVDARISGQQKDKILTHTFEFFKN